MSAITKWFKTVRKLFNEEKVTEDRNVFIECEYVSQQRLCTHNIHQKLALQDLKLYKICLFILITVYLLLIHPFSLRN